MTPPREPGDTTTLGVAQDGWRGRVEEEEDHGPVRPRTLVTLTSLTAAFPESIILDLSTVGGLLSEISPEISNWRAFFGGEDLRYVDLTGSGVQEFGEFVSRRFVGG